MITVTRRKGRVRWLRWILLLAALVGWGGAGAAPSGQAVVLYDQTSTGAFGQPYITSSKFAALLSEYDSQAADDFWVPDEKIWQVLTVTVAGKYDGTGADLAESVLIEFYSNAITNLPGTMLRSNTIPGNEVAGLGSGTFSIRLAPPFVVGPGRYWVSVQAAMTSSAAVQWVWYESDTQFFNESVWREPGNGLASGCITFMPRKTVCDRPTGTPNPDVLFKLEGTELDIVSQIRLPIVSR